MFYDEKFSQIRDRIAIPENAKDTIYLTQKNICSFLIIISTRLSIYYRYVNIFSHKILRQTDIAQTYIQSAIFNSLLTDIVVGQTILNKKIPNIITE